MGDSELSAYAQLMEKAEKLRKFEPELSKDQAFAKVYQDPRIGVGARGEDENRPDPRTGTNYPYAKEGTLTTAKGDVVCCVPTSLWLGTAKLGTL